MKKGHTENRKSNNDRITKQLFSPDIDYKTLGRHMQAVRKQQGLTQATVAEYMRIGIKYYSAIECGSAKINLYRLIQFICLTHTSADILLVGCHHDYPTHYICPNESNEDLKLLMALLEHCSRDTIRTVRALAETLIQSNK